MPTRVARAASFGADLLAARDGLVGRMVEELRAQHYCLAHVEPHAEQLLIDVRWAAQLAGRELGRRTRTYTSVVGGGVPGLVTVVVATVETWSASGVSDRIAALAALERLLPSDHHLESA